MSTTRTFIAVDVSDQMRSRAGDLIHRLSASGAKVSWVAAQNMHLTIKFLGDQSDQQLAAICRAVNEVGRDLPAFDFRCHGAGAFPSLKRPRTLWMGVIDGLEPLRQLHASLDQSLSKLGFPRDRRAFHPHLTIGRVRSGGTAVEALSQLLEAHVEFPGAGTEAAEVVVYASRLRRSGAEYEVLARAPLGG